MRLDELERKAQAISQSPGLVGVVAQDLARYSAFSISLTGLQTPPGTGIKWQLGPSIASNTNVLVEALLSTDAAWLFILNDDHAFDGDILIKLLSHEADIVFPLCLNRMPPYKPVVFSEWADQETGLRNRVDLRDHPEGGVIPVHSGGAAGMLVYRRVFEYLEAPWFEAGKASNVDLGEDVYFCDKARTAGFTLVADLDAPMGHCTTATVWPVRTPEWTYGFEFTGGLEVAMPPDAWSQADLVGAS